MTISERVFERLNQLNITQKEFSEETGIKQSTISEWKNKGTNPSSEKIMPICKVLGVTPEWLLSGIDKAGRRGSEQDFLVIDKKSDIGILVEDFKSLNFEARNRVLGYVAAFSEMSDKRPLDQ